jgi:hypothetical protein
MLGDGCSDNRHRSRRCGLVAASCSGRTCAK